MLTNPTDIIGKIDDTFLTVVVLCFIVFATASTNLIANFVPSKYSLLNFFPKNLNSNSSGVLIGIFAFFIGGSWLSILSQFGVLSIIDTIGAFFGPIFGIVIADYYIIKKKEIVNKDIFSSKIDGAYYFSGGWHLRAIYSLFVAFIFSSATIWNEELRFLQSFAWIIGATIGFIMYYLVSKK
jgi:NCS1 family nucleobase:cation symporter-1